jgi:cysteinyl-tRNA synthetase
MDLKLYDTLTREKRVFQPLDPARVRMYVCGPTVYDFAHIGNARPVIVFDVLFRLLRHLAKENGWGDVLYVRNITDVDDKINARAAERGIPISELTSETTKQFHNDIRALGVLMPNDVNVAGGPPVFIEPRATEHIAEMKRLIEDLVKSGNAYVAAEHVLFHVPSMPDYGKLSKNSLDEMIVGARVDPAPYKRDPMDFVLWKPSKPGEPKWPSPRGIATPGRPGWHIECSAMAWKYLGETFDIHGGGIDLVFPHHENEIAQSRCAFHAPVMANYWMHNGFLQVEGEKMAKSLGNFITIRELLTNWRGIGWPGESLRFYMLGTHYRQPMDWTFEGLEEAHKILSDWYENIEGVPANDQVPSEIVESLCDDLNTPQLIAALHELRSRGQMSALRSSLHLLGFSGDRTNLGRKRYLSITFGTNQSVSVSVGIKKQVDVTQNIVSEVISADEAPDHVKGNLEVFSTEKQKRRLDEIVMTRAVVSRVRSVADQLIVALHKLGDRAEPSALRSLLHLLGFSGDRARLGREHHVNIAFARKQSVSVSVGIQKQVDGTQNTVSGVMSASEAPDHMEAHLEVFPTNEQKRQIDERVMARTVARKARNFAEADRIRAELDKLPVVLRDHKDGTTTWEVKR